MVINTGSIDTIYFWRDRTGHEIDLVEDEGKLIHAAEIKSGRTIASDAFAGLTMV